MTDTPDPIPCKAEGCTEAVPLSRLANGGLYCSDACRNRAKQKERRRNAQLELPDWRECRCGCGMKFQPISNRHEYASRQCSERALYARKTGRAQAQAVVNAANGGHISALNSWNTPASRGVKLTTEERINMVVEEARRAGTLGAIIGSSSNDWGRPLIRSGRGTRCSKVG